MRIKTVIKIAIVTTVDILPFIIHLSVLNSTFDIER